MSTGPGKYDAELSQALRSCGARQGILIVIDGQNGPSFCAQLAGEFALNIPSLLREVADSIEKDALTLANDVATRGPTL